MISQRVPVLLAAVSLLAACQTRAPVRELPAPVRAPTVEGSWKDPNGIVSTFQGGTFNTRTTDEKRIVLATGSYVVDPSGMIQINLYSNVKKTASRANCQLATANQLNCTSDSGAQFSLQRANGAMAPMASAGPAPLGSAPATMAN